MVCLAPWFAATAAPAQDSAAIQFVGLSPSLSFGILHAPAFDLTPTVGGGSTRLSQDGVEFGLDAEIRLGESTFLEWNGSLFSYSGSRNISSTTPTSGAFTITSGTLPTGTITVDVTPATAPAQAYIQIITTAPPLNPADVGETKTTNSSPETPAGNYISHKDFSLTAGGFMADVLVLLGDKLTAAGYGLISDQGGFIITGFGGPGWTTVNTVLRDTTDGSDQMLMLGHTVQLGQGWLLTPQIGVDAQHISRSIFQGATYNLGSNLPVTEILPAVSFSQTEQLRSDYLALMGGLGFSRPIGQGWTLSNSLDVGRGWMSGSYHSQSDISVVGFGDQSVVGASQHYSAQPWIGRVTIGASRSLTPNTTVTFGLFCSYLSAVPTVVTTSVSAPPSASSSTTTSTTAANQVAYTRGVITRPQYSVGLSVNLVYRF
ncbi:hypothetical protein GALL_393890 [mine drainage metagenome]|uniref:Uncharacterized protein n=1 Tax=mine drainage metagenome TaxID=410659 RepID=A0A1J5QN36_9ZZZZ